MIRKYMKTSFIFRMVLAALIPLAASVAVLGQTGDFAPDQVDWTSFNPVTALTTETFAQPPAAGIVHHTAGYRAEAYQGQRNLGNLSLSGKRAPGTAASGGKRLERLHGKHSARYVYGAIAAF